jgi:hypothetical protein
MQLSARFIPILLSSAALTNAGSSHIHHHDQNITPSYRSKRMLSSETVALTVPDLDKLTQQLCAASDNTLHRRQASPTINIPISDLNGILQIVQNFNNEIVSVLQGIIDNSVQGLPGSNVTYTTYTTLGVAAGIDGAVVPEYTQTGGETLSIAAGTAGTAVPGYTQTSVTTLDVAAGTAVLDYIQTSWTTLGVAASTAVPDSTYADVTTSSVAAGTASTAVSESTHTDEPESHSNLVTERHDAKRNVDISPPGLPSEVFPNLQPAETTASTSLPTPSSSAGLPAEESLSLQQLEIITLTPLPPSSLTSETSTASTPTDTSPPDLASEVPDLPLPVATALPLSDPASAATTPASPSSTAAPQISNSTYVFNPLSSRNVAVYFGQTPATGSTTLAATCADPAIDMIVLAFVTGSTPASDGSGAVYPNVNFGAACGGQTRLMASTAPGLLSCPDLAQNITVCQQTHGKKVMLSVGGATGNIILGSGKQASDLADALWKVFGPPGQIEYVFSVLSISYNRGGWFWEIPCIET